MRLFSFIMLLLSISMFLYLFGYRPIYKFWGLTTDGTAGGDYANRATPYVVSCSASNLFCTDPTIIIGAMIGGLLLGAGILVVLGGGFAAFYLVPLILLAVLLNFVFFPFDFVNMLPPPLNIISMVIFNVLEVFAIASFTRGGV